MNKIWLYLVFFLGVYIVEAESEEETIKEPIKEYVVLKCRNLGLFSLFNDILALLDSYEKGNYSGIEVNFGTKGLYYDPDHGPNWFEYYFEPIQTVKDEQSIIHNVVGTSIPFSRSSIPSAPL